MRGGRLGGKVAIITGAASGIGAAAVRLFASEGARVVVADVDAAKGRMVASAVMDGGGEAAFVPADVSRAADVEALVRAANERYGGLDVLFNNAGVNVVGNVVEQTEDDWDRVVAVNLKGVFLGMKYAIPAMLKRGGGSIVNTASAFGHVGSARHSAYSAAKGGVVTLTYSTAAAFSAQNIRVNCISPGFIETPMLARNRPMDEVRPRMAARVPQGRMGTADEVARVALFLASDEASHVTGTAVHVDGGYVHAGR